MRVVSSSENRGHQNVALETRLVTVLVYVDARDKNGVQRVGSWSGGKIKKSDVGVTTMTSPWRYGAFRALAWAWGA